MPEAAETTWSDPHGLSEDSYDSLYAAFQGGLVGVPGFGLAFGLFCAAVGTPLVGLCVFFASLLILLDLFVEKQSFYRRATTTLRFRLAIAGYAQLCFIIPSVIIVSRLAHGGALVLGLGCMVTAVFFYARYYYRAYWRAWEEEKSHNETKSLDLKHGLYFPAEPFQTADVRSLGWDEKVGKALCVIGPLGGGALGVVAGRGAGVSTLMILCVAFSFFIGMAWSQMTVQVLVHRQKIRYYERKIGKPIRNR